MKVSQLYLPPSVIVFYSSSLTSSLIESKCLVMHPYKGELMMTQSVKVSITNSSGAVDAAGGSDASERTVPIIRVLYSFHSSGSEIKQLLGLHSSHRHHYATLSRAAQMRSSPTLCARL